ncbi:MAG: hypothetical protein KGM17_12525 [Sphingomonadales bacterium]|nr:hypothetical protein [Sphingomonadales bacterium]
MLFYLPFCALNFHKPKRHTVGGPGRSLVGRCVRCGKRITRVGPKHWKLLVPGNA